MNWTALLIIAVLLTAFLVFNYAGLISIKDARAYLKKGALVIDVRSSC